jgi:NADP-dependent 3-hydroxy acid dehydrogenase YdfG
VRRRVGGAPIDGRTAVITGAASGIGQAMARRLAAHGCPLALADVDAAGVRATAASLGAGAPVLARAVDVGDRDAVRAFAADVVAWAPAPLGMVFNNAGVTALQRVADGAPEDDDWVMDTNFRGVSAGVRAFLPTLLAQRSGVVVNMSSVFGLVGVAHQSAYSASKFAVRGYTDALRQELRGTGVRAVVVHPGAVRTAIVRNARASAGEQAAAAAARSFERWARLTPERAARHIHAGVVRGRSRILVGADAVALDVLARVAPARASDVLAAALRAAR